MPFNVFSNQTVGRREELTPHIASFGNVTEADEQQAASERALHGAEARERLAIGDWPLRLMRLAEPLAAFRPAGYARRFRRPVRIQF
jgi:hypothetical protein